VPTRVAVPTPTIPLAPPQVIVAVKFDGPLTVTAPGTETAPGNASL
jgi:hypothetical protein